MAVGNVPAEQHHDMIAADLCFGEVKFARGIEGDSIAAGATSRKVVRSLDRAVLHRRVRAGLAHLGHGYASNEPRIAFESPMILLVYLRPFRPAAIRTRRAATRMQA